MIMIRGFLYGDLEEFQGIKEQPQFLTVSVWHLMDRKYLELEVFLIFIDTLLLIPVFMAQLFSQEYSNQLERSFKAQKVWQFIIFC